MICSPPDSPIRPAAPFAAATPSGRVGSTDHLVNEFGPYDGVVPATFPMIVVVTADGLPEPSPRELDQN